MKRSASLLLGLSLLLPMGELRAADPAVQEGGKERENERPTLISIVPAAPASTPDVSVAPIAPTVVPASPVPSAESLAAGDRAFLEKHHQAKTETETQTEAEEDEGAASEPLLVGGPYEEAPPGEQAEVLRRAESVLCRHRLLDDEEGEGSAEALLEEALFRYQSAERLPLTGQLDARTLASMRLLPESQQPRRSRLWKSEVESPAIEVYRGRTPRSRNEPPPPHPNVVRGIPLN